MQLTITLPDVTPALGAKLARKTAHGLHATARTIDALADHCDALADRMEAHAAQVRAETAAHKAAKNTKLRPQAA